jgi:hypothetical protein
MKKQAVDSLEAFAAFARGLSPGTAAQVPQHLLSPEVLRDLQAQTPPMTQIWELRGRASPRDLVLESLGILDLLLSKLLSTRMRRDASILLLGEKGKIRDLELKIDLAYAFEVIELADSHSLHVLRRIRNSFAHDPHLREFEHDRKIIGLLSGIGPDQLFFPPIPLVSLRDRFVGAALKQVVKLEYNHRIACLKTEPEAKLSEK